MEENKNKKIFTAGIIVIAVLLGLAIIGYIADDNGTGIISKPVSELVNVVKKKEYGVINKNKSELPDIYDTFDCSLVGSKVYRSDTLTEDNCLNIINPKTGHELSYKVVEFGKESLYNHQFGLKDALIEYHDGDGKQRNVTVKMRVLDTDEEAGYVVTTFPRRDIDNSDNKMKLTLGKTHLKLGESIKYSVTFNDKEYEGKPLYVYFTGGSDIFRITNETITVKNPFDDGKICARVTVDDDTFMDAYLTSCVDVTYDIDCDVPFTYKPKHDYLDRTNGYKTPTFISKCPGTYAIYVPDVGNENEHYYLRLRGSEGDTPSYFSVDKNKASLSDEGEYFTFTKTGTMEIPLGVNSVQFVKKGVKVEDESLPKEYTIIITNERLNNNKYDSEQETIRYYIYPKQKKVIKKEIYWYSSKAGWPTTFAPILRDETRYEKQLPDELVILVYSTLNRILEEEETNGSGPYYVINDKYYSSNTNDLSKVKELLDKLDEAR